MEKVIKASLERANDGMVFVQSDISAAHSELCRTNPMAAVGVRDLMADIADLQIRINEMAVLSGDSND